MMLEDEFISSLIHEHLSVNILLTEAMIYHLNFQLKHFIGNFITNFPHYAIACLCVCRWSNIGNVNWNLTVRNATYLMRQYNYIFMPILSRSSSQQQKVAYLLTIVCVSFRVPTVSGFVLDVGLLTSVTRPADSWLRSPDPPSHTSNRRALISWIFIPALGSSSFECS